jgi:membrane dipeptidase
MTPFICDTHSDTLMRMIDLGYSFSDKRLEVNMPKMLNGGHDLQIFACFIDPAVGKDRFVTRTLQMIDILRREMEKNKKHFALCTTLAEIENARRQKKKVAMLGLESGHAIVNDLAVLRAYRELGIVYMTLTWSTHTDWADSSGEKEKWGGLTPFGRQVVQEMNRIRMMVDVSHVSDKTFWQTLRISKKPVIASHSSVRSICNHSRNMTDKMIRAMADKGGVIFINFFSCFIHQGFSDAYDKLSKRLQQRMKIANKKWRHQKEMYTYEEEKLLQSEKKTLPKVNMMDVVKHILHVANIAGVNAVGIGSDFDGTPFMPDGLTDCTRLPILCDLLRKNGFNSSEVDKIAGGNFLRVFSEIVG